LSFGYKDCRTKIDTVDSLESSLDNVVIQVVGQLSNNRQPMRRFFQTFVLCRRNTNHYFVKNDIFRFQEFEYAEEDDYFETELNSSQVSAIEPLQSSESASINELQINSLSVSSNNEPTVASAISNNVEELNTLNVSNASNMINSGILNNSVNSGNVERVQSEPATVIEQITSTLSNHSNIVNSVSLKSNNDLFYNHEPVEESKPIEPVNDIFQNAINPIQTAVAAAAAAAQAESIRNTVSTYANMVLRSSKGHEQSPFGHIEPVQVSSLNTSSKHDFSSSGDSFAPLTKDTFETKESNGNGNDFFDTFNSNNDNGFGSHFGSSKKEFSSNTDGLQLFVGHLDQNITDEQMKKFFSQYGPVSEASINRSNQRQGKALNFGFVIFEHHDSVQKVLASKVSVTFRLCINVCMLTLNYNELFLIFFL
jgi:hypothetical protein